MLITFEATFTSFFKDKKSQESQNSRNQRFSYYFCLLIEGSGAGSGSVPRTNGSGSVPRTNGSGSGRPKTIPTDPDLPPYPDPQHCFSCRTFICSYSHRAAPYQNIWDSHSLSTDPDPGFLPPRGYGSEYSPCQS